MLEMEDHHLATSDASDTMNFWNNRVNIYDKQSLIAQDILAALASQGYVERGFSVCGLLTAGRRNRMTKSLCSRLTALWRYINFVLLLLLLLHMRACLKLNKKVLANTGFNAYV